MRDAGVGSNLRQLESLLPTVKGYGSGEESSDAGNWAHLQEEPAGTHGARLLNHLVQGVFDDPFGSHGKKLWDEVPDQFRIDYGLHG